ncbi:MAG: DUF1501 domain-containing protein [Bryobacteraceae bacterium]|nr:DUF1501 domain-containing protein [Bryobacteraceae bacterium]
MKDRFGIDWSGAKGKRFWRAPHVSRRIFFRHIASAVGGYFLLPPKTMEASRIGGAPINKAKKAIFVFMAGAPSHTDTFDFKASAATPAAFAPESYGDITWPRGILPRLAEQLDNVSLMRSVRAWAAVHELSRTWYQIGRNPTSSLSKIAPHIGSVVSMELQDKNALLPAFLSLNATTGPGQGYFPSAHAPFYVSPGGNGLGNTTHGDGQPAFDRRYALLRELSQGDSIETDFGALASELAQYNLSARRLMYNADVDRIFTFPQDERNRYGNTGFGNACIAARNLIRSDMGTRFVQITIGGWDNHAGIYTGAFNPANNNALIRQFDNGLGTLIADLKDSGHLDDTLIIAMGEFGRTVRHAGGAALNAQAGRDHHLQQAIFFAGAKVKGRSVIGSTNSDGFSTDQPGWSGDRDIRAEDVEATIYSALGIDWTTIRRDDPLNRGFEYVPVDSRYDYRPVHELWG